MAVSKEDRDSVREVLRMHWPQYGGRVAAAQALALQDAIVDTLVLAGLLRQDDRLFTAEEVIEIADETSDSFGNLYRLDFIDRIRHEAAR